MASMLQDIREGMIVVDSAGKDVGTVDFVRLSDEDPATPETETITGEPNEQNSSALMQGLGAVFHADALPEAVQERLRRTGFVRVDAKGLFAADRYILPEQIASVSGEEVRLSVGKDDLVKRP